MQPPVQEALSSVLTKYSFVIGISAPDFMLSWALDHMRKQYLEAGMDWDKAIYTEMQG